MEPRWQRLGEGVFAVADPDGGRPAVYAPLQGLLMAVNDAFIARFRNVLAGDVEAARALGMDPAEAQKFAGLPAAARQRLQPQWPARFEPTSVHIFLTHRCTLRCAYCYCQGGQGRNMPWPVYEHALRFTLENCRRLQRDLQLNFHGGDVGACWPLFQRAVAFAQEQCAAAGRRLLMTIGTNGFYNEERARYLARTVQGATLSIDGAPEAHDAHRITAAGGGSLARIIETARIFDAHALPYSVRMTVTRGTVDQLPAGVDFICRHTRPQSIRAEPVYARGRAVHSPLEAPDPEVFVARFREARVVAQQHGRALAYSGARVGGAYPSFCTFTAPTFGVTPDGNLTSCYEVLHPDDPLRETFFYGHITPDGAAMVVDQARIDAIRATASRQREGCGDCFCAFSCAGDCAAKALDRAPGHAPAPARCRITRTLTHDLLQDVLSAPNRPSGQKQPP